jgi:thioredoxin reductase
MINVEEPVYDVAVVGGGAAGLSGRWYWAARGVWAAGNVVDPRARVITAAGAGSAAAIAINADLVQEDVERAVEDQRLASGVSSP